MANTLRVIDMVLKESQRIAHEKLSFIKTTDLQYDDSFKDNGKGKLGATLRIREPNQYTRTTGTRVMNVQDQNESTLNFTVATQDHVDMRFNSAELIQSVNSGKSFDDLSKNYIEPAIAVLCSGSEADYIAAMSKLTYQVAGTAGTALAGLTAAGAARAKLNRQLAPKDGFRSIQCDSVAMGGMVDSLKGLFQDSNQVKEQYREGKIGRTAMADWYENDRMWTMPNSADVACTINAGTLTSGVTSLTVNNMGTAPVEGMVFTISRSSATAGIMDCHPETKASYGTLKQFVCAAGCTTTNLVFTPAVIFDSTNAKQNCVGSLITADDITFVGAASTNYAQQLMYHKEAYAFVTADLPIMDDAQKCMRSEKDGLSMRVWMGSDIRNDELLLRCDILYGWAALRPAWGCRIIGQAG